MGCRSCFPWIGILNLIAAASVFAATSVLPPDTLVKQTSDEVVAVLKERGSSGLDDGTLEQVKAKVLPHFDFRRMTRLAAGKNWRKATAEQQEQWVKEFRDLIVRTYSSALKTYRDQKIEVKPLDPESQGAETVVKTRVVQPGRQPIAIDYSMEKTPEGWKVYDVAVEGVSLVTTYRATFDAAVSQGGVDGLLKALAAKNRENGSGS